MARIRHRQSLGQADAHQASQTLVLSTLANAVTWAAFPPLEWFPLAWLAPVAWARLIQVDQLPGRRPYWTIWAVSALVWGVLLEGVGRAYWANYFGLVLLGSYLAIYQALFVGLARVAVHRWKISLIFAAPTVWTGLELVRGYMITGFSMALLGHSQAKVTLLIQIADVVGAYGVSFLLVFVGACIARALPQPGGRWSCWPLATAAAVVACVLVYGRVQMADRIATTDSKRLKVALIQGTEDTVLDSDIAAAQQRASDTFNQYWRLTLDVREKHDDLDLVVWPEGVFSGNVPQLVVAGDVVPPPDAEITSEQLRQFLAQRMQLFDEKTRGIAQAVNRPTTPDAAVDPRTHFLVGCDAVELQGHDQQTYNAALFINPLGKVVARYDKMHRVLLGEYVPLGDRFPWLYELVPIGRGLTPGRAPVAFDVRGVVVSPSICFEDTVPHLIRRQVRALAAQGARPDVLVNLTNDGWFWGSGILDLQLSCAIYRAVELRRPMLVAANTGLTASIDSNGVVLDTLPRREEGAVVTEVAIGRRSSLYEQWGDLFAGICLAVCVALAIAGCHDSVQQWRLRE